MVSKYNQGRVTYRHSVGPPIGGWNTRDDVTEMPRQDAETLDNWLPDTNKVVARKGFEVFATGVGSGRVDMLSPMSDAANNIHLLAAGGGTIYDITGGTASSIRAGTTPVAWDTVSFNNKLTMVNGSDHPLEYDGTSIAPANFSVDGINPERFSIVHLFKNRTYYGAVGELAFWYTELLANDGILTKFPLHGIANRGGWVVAINSWSVDGGAGPDDYFCAFTSEGEVIVYAGSDPGSDFALVGVFYIGRILGNAVVAAVNGKLLTATERDYVFLPDQLQEEGGGFDSKLSGAAKEAISKYKNFRGWQAHYSPSEGLLIVNAPTGNATSIQHVLNVKTRAGTRYTGINAAVWADFNGELYFGGYDGSVNRYTGSRDGGSAITCIARTAPALLRSPSEKQVPSYRFKFLSDGTVAPTTGLAWDFDKVAFTQSISISADYGSVLPADWPFDWSSENERRQEWQRGAGMGTYVQGFVSLPVSVPVSWQGVDYIVEPGGDQR